MPCLAALDIPAFTLSEIISSSNSASDASKFISRYTSLLVATVTSAGCNQLAERFLVWKVRNKPVLDFELTAIDGERVRLSHYRGRPVVLAFWSHH